MDQRIRKQRQERSQVGEILSAPKRATNVDYARKNVENMRKKQKENKERADNIEAAKEPFKLKRFKNIQSTMTRGGAPPPEPQEPVQRIQDIPGGPRIVTYDPAEENAVAPPARAPPEQPSHAKQLNPSYGKVPTYINDIKKERAEARR